MTRANYDLCLWCMALHIYVHLSVFLEGHAFLSRLSVYLFIYLSFCLHVARSFDHHPLFHYRFYFVVKSVCICLFVSVCLVCLSVCLPLTLSIYIYISNSLPNSLIHSCFSLFFFSRYLFSSRLSLHFSLSLSLSHILHNISPLLCITILPSSLSYPHPLYLKVRHGPCLYSSSLRYTPNKLLLLLLGNPSTPPPVESLPSLMSHLSMYFPGLCDRGRSNN